jgi:hypothetical protein
VNGGVLVVRDDVLVVRDVVLVVMDDDSGTGSVGGHGDVPPTNGRGQSRTPPRSLI